MFNGRDASLSGRRQRVCTLTRPATFSGVSSIEGKAPILPSTLSVIVALHSCARSLRGLRHVLRSVVCFARAINNAGWSQTQRRERCDQKVGSLVFLVLYCWYAARTRVAYSSESSMSFSRWFLVAVGPMLYAVRA
jgi:hypothetical protein